jgi:hypothetical protein
MYPTLLGLNERGDVVVALTDFLLTGNPYASPSEASEPVAAPPQEPAGDSPSTPSRWKKMFGRS